MGILGWAPSEFWEAQLYEVAYGLEAKVDHQLELRGAADSRHASWMLNGIRAAIWTKKWQEIAPDDLYDPDPKTKEEVEEEREHLSEVFPATLD